MSTALHLKLTTKKYVEGFPQALTYVQAATNNSDGFQLLYRIFEIIHPQLRAEKGGINKSFEAPKYSDIKDDSIYTFISRYKNYLMYKALSTEKSQYNKKELVLFIVRALKSDERSKPSLESILTTLQAYQRDSRSNPDVTFPFDLEINEIVVTIDNRCISYTVGDSITTNSYAEQGIIRALKRHNYGKVDHKSKNTPTQRPTSNILCKSCYEIGHGITQPDTICYNLANAHLCSMSMANEKNAKVVRENTCRFKKNRKEKADKSQVNKKMDTFMKKLGETGRDDSTLMPIINLA